MARKGEAGIRSQFLNYLRFSVDETAAATYTQNEFDTNLSAERGVMMEIHSIEASFTTLRLLREVAAGDEESFAMQVTRETKAAMIDLNDSDTILRVDRNVSRSAAIGTDAGPLWIPFQKQVSIDFAMPIPYVKPSIFIAVLGTFASGGGVRGRIGYTLRDISREEFLELLVALQ